jgi:hypothetical protein
LAVYSVHVLIGDYIVNSWCICNHGLAVLCKIDYAYNKQYISPAYTSVPQGWNKGTQKEVDPNKVKNLTFRQNPGLNQTLRKEFDPKKNPEDRNIANKRISLSFIYLVLIFIPYVQFHRQYLHIFPYINLG